MAVALRSSRAEDETAAWQAYLRDKNNRSEAAQKEVADKLKEVAEELRYLRETRV